MNLTVRLHERLRLARLRALVFAHWIAGLTLLLAAITVLTAWAVTSGYGRSGPRGLYFRGAEWQGPVIDVEEYAPLTTEALAVRARAWGGQSFSAIWSGVLDVAQEGPYRVSVASDDGAWVYVDDRLVVDNGGAHPRQKAEGTATLTPGSHRVTVRYTQHTGDVALDVSIAGPDGVERPLASALTTRPGAAILPWVRPFAEQAPLLWTLLIALWPARWLLRRFVTQIHEDGRAWQTRLIVGVVMAVALLALFDIGWGLPAKRAWEPDEVVPMDVLTGIDQRFSNGWRDLYPPVQFYVLSVLYLPFVIASRLGLLDLSESIPYLSLFLIGRATSAAMAAVTAGALYLTARELGHSVRASLMAVIVAASMPIFVYYGRVANVDMPYVMWYAVAWWIYARIVRRGATVARCAALGTTAALAVCTKDQAYAFFVLIAAHLAWRTWKFAAGRGVSRLAVVARSRPLWAGAATFALSFAVLHNLLWNLEGFRAHLRTITGVASQGYRMYDGSLTGQAQLFGTALVQVPWSLGWPALTVAAIGLAVVLRRRDHATAAVVWLPIASWYLFLIVVIGYHYDRFFLGPCLGLAMLAGVGLEAVVDVVRPHWAGLTLAGAVLAFGIVNGASVPVLMHHDSRYAVEHWLGARLAPGTRVAFIGRREYLPRLDQFRRTQIPPRAEGLLFRPAVCVTNWSYTLRSRHDPPAWSFYEALEGGSIGYRLALRYRTPVWTPLALFPRMTAAESSPFTNLNKINPEIRVYERAPAAPPKSAEAGEKGDGMLFLRSTRKSIPSPFSNP